MKKRSAPSSSSSLLRLLMTRYQTLIPLQVCAGALDIACSGHVLKPRRRKKKECGQGQSARAKLARGSLCQTREGFFVPNS